MVKKFLLPQEIEVYYIIPTIKRYLTQYLKESGMKQKDIAKLLQIQEATVSQYLSNKRGHQINFDSAIEQEIKKSSTRINDMSSYICEIQRLLKIIRHSKTLCNIHKQFSTVPSTCTAAEMGCNT
ncbi:transcriptional regulator [Candidatus Woesearchaeota archaeon]|nr:MAG: transcriptional regulator [Candidatus Woesearchaeota archaeon]